MRIIRLELLLGEFFLIEPLLSSMYLITVTISARLEDKREPAARSLDLDQPRVKQSQCKASISTSAGLVNMVTS